VLNQEEQRLADLLKRAVPEPPRQLSVGQVAGRRAGRRPGTRAPWTRPVLAAAAVVIIGITTALAARHWSAGTAPAPHGTVQPAASASSPSPHRTPGSPARSVTVPNLFGSPAASAEQVLERLGLSVKVIPTYVQGNIPAGEVVAESPAAGTIVPSKATINVIVAIG
jgi:PASTA domain